ncbi:hypothetical protein MBLNU459_g5046t1 [Dothideomycetes sp. NU459]
MPAPLAKGIIITLSLLAAIGVAVLENPQVKEWIEEQRRKIAEALRSLGEELDPQARRQAEAFAYEGQLPSQTPQESVGIANAIAVATGRDTNDSEVGRRNRPSSVSRKSDPIDAAERRRLGREYLARRNQEMLDIQERNKMRKSSSLENPPPADKLPSFDNLVNEDGSLKLSEKQLPSPPAAEPERSSTEHDYSEKRIPIEEIGFVPMESVLSREMDKFVHQEDTNKYRCKVSNCTKLFKGINYWQRHFETRHQDIYEQEKRDSSNENGFQTGSRFANPFGDEFELSEPSLLDRSTTPKPPVPPKIAIGHDSSSTVREIAVQEDEPDLDGLTYEEQLARALSLSLAESAAERRVILARTEETDPDLAAAIAASLADEEETRRKSRDLGSAQLVDLTPDPPVSVPQSQDLDMPRHKPFVVEPGSWTNVYAGSREDARETHSHNDSNDELYFLSPQLTQRQPTPISEAVVTPPYDPVHEAANKQASPPPLSSPPMLLDLSAAAPQTSIASLIDLHADAQAQRQEEPHTPTTATLSPAMSRDSITFPSDASETEDEFASVASGPSNAQSEGSLIDVDADMDVQSVADSSDDEGGDGVITPGSWTDVGSEIGSEDGHHLAAQEA